MSNLDVAVRVRLISQLRGPSREARRDLEGVERAARKLNGARGGEKIARDLKSIEPATRKVAGGLQGVERAAQKLSRERPGDGIERSLRRAEGQAERTRRAVERAHSGARGFGGRGAATVREAEVGIGRIGEKAGTLDRGFVRLGGSIGSAAGALLAFAAPAAIIAGLNQIEDRVTALDRKYASLAVTAEMRDPKVVEKLRSQDTKIGLKYGMRPEQVQPLRNAFVAGGLDLDTAEQVTDPSARAVKAMDASPENIAQTVLAAVQNLGIAPKDIPLVLDMVAKGTKKGRFEADSVAKYLPQYGAAYQGMGYTGLDAVAEINALAQIVRQGSGTADAAGTNLDNLLQKIFAPDARKNFAEKGVNLEEVRDRAKKEGKSYVAAVLEEVNKLTKGGDPFLVTDLFGDMQVLNALRAVLPRLKELEEWRKEIRDQSDGTVEQDWQFLAKTPAEEQEKMGAIAASGRDQIAKEWWQPLMTMFSRLDAFLFNSEEFNRQRSLEVTNPEEFRRREQNQRRAEGVAAQRDSSGYDAASAAAKGHSTRGGGFGEDQQYIDDLVEQSKINIRKMREAGQIGGESFNDGLRDAGAKAVDTMDVIMKQIEARGDVTISPKILPQIQSPASVEPPTLRAVPLPPSRPPQKQSSAGGARTFAQTNHITIQGASDPAATGRAVAARLAQLGNGSSNLFDPVG